MFWSFGEFLLVWLSCNFDCLGRFVTCDFPCICQLIVFVILVVS